MKKFKSLLIASCLMMSSISFADQKTTSAPFSVNPDSIRTQLLSQNISLLQSLNNVENSKLNLNMARANLFPSLNLGILLPALANPTFLLGSITFLFPFLVPSNWAVLDQEKNLFEADKSSYNALELNLLANVYSLYYTFINDQKVQSAYQEQANVLTVLYTSLKDEYDTIGDVSVETLNMAKANMDNALVTASKINELLINEKANLRTALALPLGTELTVENIDIVKSSFEDQNVSDVVDRAMAVAPEVAQLQYLVKAAKANKFAKQVGFISQASIGGAATSSSDAFGNLKAGGAFTFGLNNIVSVQLADNNIDSIKLGQTNLKQQTEKTAEILVNQLSEMKVQLNLSQDAYQSQLIVNEAQKEEYEMGIISLQTYLLTQSQLTSFKVNLAKSQLDYQLQRLALLRLVIDGEFNQVKGCSGEVVTANNKSFSFSDLFGKKKTPTLDQVCHQ